MTHTLYRPFVSLLFLLALLTTSCDKMDKNGDLDGTWQLLEWTDLASSQPNTEATKKIYMTVKLDLIQFRYLNNPDVPQFYTRFTHAGNSLTIGKAFKAPFDEVVPLSQLAPYGITPDGRFTIERLDDERLILSNEANRLTFRRY